MLDLAVANSGSNNVSVLLGNGDGTFQAAIAFGAGFNPHFVALGDFNSDGRLDLAAVNYGSATATVSVLLGNGDGTFHTAENSATSRRAWALAVGDFHGDRRPDLAVANTGL